MIYKVELKKFEPQPIASIRRKIKARQIPKLFPEFMKKIFGFLNENRIHPKGAPIAIFYDFKKGKGDVELGIPISKPINSEGEIISSFVPGGKAAYLLYTGHIRKISRAYDAMIDWIKKNGFQYTNIWWEVYLTDPYEVPDRNKWQTEIYLLLK